MYEAQFCTKECKPLPQDCTPCDYSVMGENCGTSHPINSTESCLCEKRKEWCEDESEANEFITISEGISDYFEIGLDKPSQTFRFHFEKLCHNVLIKIHYVYGSVVSYFDTDLSVTRGNLIAYPEALFCPKDFFYQYGTYTLTVYGYLLQASKISISIEYFDLSDKEETALEEVKLCDGSNLYYCPKLGVPNGPIYGKQLVPMFFKVIVTECIQLAFHREMTWSSLNTTGQMGFGFGTNLPVLDNKGYHLVSPRNLVLSVCPPEGGPTTTTTTVDFILSFSNLAIDYELIIWLSPFSDEWVSREISNFGVTDLYRILIGLFDIECGKQIFSCRKGAFEWGLSCLETWSVVPTIETTGLWPRPSYLSSRDPETFTNLPFDYDTEVNSMKVSGGLFLEVSTANDVSQTLSNWRTELEQNCSVNFRLFSNIMSKDGIPVRGIFSFKDSQVEPVCTFESFLNISEQLDLLSQQMSQETDSYDILSTRYIIDMHTFTPTWLGCQKEIEGYLEEKESMLEFIGTTACPREVLDQNNESINDACCNTKLSWSSCCVPRTISYTSITLQIPQEMSDHQYCGNSECMKPLLEDYIFYHELRDSIQGCSSAIQETLSQKHFNVYKFYRNCKEQIFGEDGYGKDCLIDDDCYYDGRETGSICDFTTNKCIFLDSQNLDKGYTVFFECLDENMPVSVRDYLERMIETKGSQSILENPSFVQQMKQLYVINECVESIGRSDLSQGVRQESISPDTCPPCEYVCFDRSCLPPWRCEGLETYGRPSSGCFYAEKSIPSSRVICESQMVCNWNSTIESESECINESSSSSFFCGYCPTPTSCQMVNANNEQECINMNGCMIGSGSGNGSDDGVDIVLNITESECEKSGFCSLQCNGCQDEDTCLNSGYCTDINYGEYLNFSAPYYYKSTDKILNSTSTSEGYCILHINEWNEPDCVKSSADVSINIPTSIGCLTYQSDKPACKKGSGTWYSYNTNKEQCESKRACIEPQVLTNMRTPKDKEQCELCGGSSIPVFEWKEAKWINGKAIKFEWIEKKWIGTNRWEPTIDFSSLGDDIKDSVTEFYSFELQTEAQCRLNPSKNSMEKILCYCSQPTSQDLCLENKNIAIGVGRLCYQQTYALVAPPSILQFSEGSLTDGCVDISVETILMSDIKKPPQSSISTSFRKKRYRVDSIKNSNGVYVGKFLGNGVSIRFSEQDLVNNFTLCLDTEFEPDQHYPDYDFGLRLSEEEIKPLSIIITNKHGTICGVIDVLQFDNILIYPISTSEDWESEDDSLSNSEKIIFSVMLSLYLILFLFKFFEEIFVGFKDMKPSRWIGFLVLSCLIVRSIYFIFLLGDAISTTEDTLTEFLLVEIPTYLYFLAISVTAILWSSASGLKNLKETIKKLILNFSYILFFALAFLISIIIAWNLSGQSGSYKCGGRVYEEPDDSTRKSIRLAYRIVISIATLAIAGSLTYHGLNVYLALDKNMAKTEANERFQKKILLVGWASTLSLLGQCIFFICYSQLTSPSAEWVLILIPLELIPMSFISIVLSADKLSSKLTGSKSSSGTDN